MSKNDITGDRLVSKISSGKYNEGFDRIWGKKCDHDWRSDGDPGPGEIMTLTCSRCGKETKAVPTNKGEL